MKKIYRSTYLIFALPFLLMGCAKDHTTTKTTSVKQEMSVVTDSDIPILDVNQATDTTSFDLFNNTMEGLYRLDPKSVPTPGIATSYTLSKDGLTYTFHLRHHATWSNGEEVTAKDFVFGWKKVLDPKTNSPYAYIMFDIKNAEKANNGDVPLDQVGIKALDDYTFQVTLERPTTYFLSLTTFPTFYPQHESFVKKEGKNYAKSEHDLLYDGPFLLKDLKKDKGWTLAKNPTYWDAKHVKMNAIHYVYSNDDLISYNMYLNHEVDLIFPTSEYVDLLKSSPEFSSVERSDMYFLRFNENNPVLKNKNIRQAIDLAYNKQLIANSLLKDGSVGVDYFVPEHFVSLNGQDFRSKYPNFHSYDTKAATAAWEEGLKEIGQTHVTLEYYATDADNSIKMGRYLKETLEKVLPGLTLQPHYIPFNDVIQLESEEKYDIASDGWGPDYQDPMTFLDMFASDNSLNQSGYNNPTYDDLIHKAQVTYANDPSKRWQTMQEAEKILINDDSVISPIYQSGKAYLKRSSVHGLVSHPFGPEWSYKWMYIK